MTAAKRGSKSIRARAQPATTAPTPHLALPHERDETTGTPAPEQPVIVQAQKDLARDLEDTDCYTRLHTLIPRGRGKG